MDDAELHNLLFRAVQHHNDSLLDDLLEDDRARAMLDWPGPQGNMLLHTAVLENELRCVECLLKHGSNPNVFDTIRARTPLHLAVELGHTDIVKAFLELDHVNLDTRDDRNLSCHEIAQYCDRPELATLIKARQDEIEELRNDFYTVINQACTSNEPELVRELLYGFEKRIVARLPRGWSLDRYGKLFAQSSMRQLINWSSSSWNEVTLLFKCASRGYTQLCELLIEFGATARCIENTNYSALYVAAYGGYTDTVRLLLDNFPALVCEVTIERWTVLHACCLQGHADTAKLLLEYAYPAELRRRFVSRSGDYEYEFAFDLNAQDAAGQTAVYLAVSADCEPLLDTLLHFKCEASLCARNNRSAAPGPLGASSSIAASSTTTTNTTTSPHTAEVVCSETSCDSASSRYLICPFELDTYCDYNSKTALHLAVCEQRRSLATTLLVHGAKPNLPILSRDTLKSDLGASPAADAGLNWLRSSKSSCLREACKLNDEPMCDTLIRYGAVDNQDNMALQAAASNANQALVSRLLALKSNVDPEYKINSKCNSRYALVAATANCQQHEHSRTTTFYSSVFPSTAVMLDWQDLKCIKRVELRWLIEASLAHNKRLKQAATGLAAITRIDLSANRLKSVPAALFCLPSLRVLNLANNLLELLPDARPELAKLAESRRAALRRSRSSSVDSPKSLDNSNGLDNDDYDYQDLPWASLRSPEVVDEPRPWRLPCLETLDLRDNRLTGLPECVFELPRLTELDVSSNQIRQLPWAMWASPALRELIASGNLLDELPRAAGRSPAGVQSSPSTMAPAAAPLSAGSGRDSTMEDRASSTASAGPFGYASQSQDSLGDRRPAFTAINTPVTHLHRWRRGVDLVRELAPSGAPDHQDGSTASTTGGQVGSNKIAHLNLSYNSFAKVPGVLACAAPELARLNLSHNRLTSLGNVALLPPKLKSLDLSYNQIAAWFSTGTGGSGPNESPAQSRECALTPGNPNCVHKLHERLDSLRSLNLSRNRLTSVELHHTNTKLLVYPNLTTLDLSFNRLELVPRQLAELRDLSVLNLAANGSISALPNELGLLGKLWNLNVNGCKLAEPLKSIVESKSYKTMDVIGYLRSILEEAKPYARMKLMLVGLQGIGKTSLLEQMRHEGSSRRRAPPEHWTRRMGHSARANLRNQRGVTLSTVGVDIHEWTFCKRTARGEPSFGPVSFSTWDFGGQREFYATHRYFLSKRSIYLVVWRLTDGIQGIQGIQQWLVNIESRAPGSPVIIVGTHEDALEGGERGPRCAELQAQLRDRFVNLSERDKCGLPAVMDALVVSTKSKLNIKRLCNRIYDVVFSLRCPRSHERLLEQKIPATYLYLEEIINSLVHERAQRKREPVLSYAEYRRVTSDQLLSRYGKRFRDLESPEAREINYNSELQQASRFLHENGVLLHYEDANLRDLYFLDPQWLCDILSHVVTIREINPHVRSGLMKIDHLGQLFKSLHVELGAGAGVQSYVVNLLNKFEVALTWNSQYLLIPSLLPASPEDQQQCSASLDLDTGGSGKQQQQSSQVPAAIAGTNSVHNTEDHEAELRATRGPSLLAPHRSRARSAIRGPGPGRVGGARAASIEPGAPGRAGAGSGPLLEAELAPERALQRLVLLRYLPAGFFARLQSALLADRVYDDLCAELGGWLARRLCTELPGEPAGDSKPGSRLTGHAGWLCWQNGVRLALQRAGRVTFNSRSRGLAPLLEMRQLDSSWPQFGRMLLESGPAPGWHPVDATAYPSIISISVLAWRIRATSTSGATRYLVPERRAGARLLAAAVDTIDSLLEDWYPCLGARFAHTLAGSYLVARAAACAACFASSSGPVHCFHIEQCTLDAYNLTEAPRAANLRALRAQAQQQQQQQQQSLFTATTCPRHGHLKLASLAPDLLFHDLAESARIHGNQLERCKLIGRGTFGFVFQGVLRGSRPAGVPRPVALKLLQPAEPGSDAEPVDVAAYKSARAHWDREPLQTACKAYCTARHEVNILHALEHPNIVPFVGVCTRPLALVLGLAPLGSLAHVFKNYKRAATRVHPAAAQQSLLQVARALEFLHQQRIIYRDLKSENVLVWAFPSPFATQPDAAGAVELKLADYGISRHALSAGLCKGFAGTINFLAPEILRHNGDEEYTDKVDCFSFAMFAYELLTLRAPHKQAEPARSSQLADSSAPGRPLITQRDLVYPGHILDLMTVCWSQEPQHRPSASQIVSIASAAEFSRVLDVCLLSTEAAGRAAQRPLVCVAIQRPEVAGELALDLWLARNLEGSDEGSPLELISSSGCQWSQQLRLKPEQDAEPTRQVSCMCLVDNELWICDNQLNMSALSLDMEPQSSKPAAVLSRQIGSLASSLDPMEQQMPTVIQMIHVTAANSVALLLNSGQLWLCHCDTYDCSRLGDPLIEFSCVTVPDYGLDPDQCEQADFGSPTGKATDVANNTGFTPSHTPIGPGRDQICYLFCGQADGITCLELHKAQVRRQSILPLADRPFDLSGERVVEPSQSSQISSIIASRRHLWTCAGCTVHLWNVDQRCVASKLDCWKLVPSSESLESINIEHYFEQARSSTVSSMVLLANQLFVATSHGCLMVVEADSLKPMTVFRPFESSITILKPHLATQYPTLATSQTADVDQSILSNDELSEPRYLVALGSGYRDLIKRYMGPFSHDACNIDTDSDTSVAAILLEI